MANVVIRRSKHLDGEVIAPPSKAHTHRMLTASLLAKGTSRISNALVSDDTNTTLRAVEAFGAEIELRGNCWTVRGVGTPRVPENPVDCEGSGTTLRFMIPTAALAPGRSVFVSGASLGKRPIAALLQSLKQLGAESTLQTREGSVSIEVHGGGIRGGKTSIVGDVSSQFVSGLLFACPKAKNDTVITLSTPLESRSYVQLTIEILRKHGVKVSTSSALREFRTSSDQDYCPCDHDVPGDFSSAAFLLAAAAVTCSKVKIENLDPCTSQGDAVILDILKKMGSRVSTSDEYVEVDGGQLAAVNIDAKDIPDLVPVVTVLTCYAKGNSRIRSVKRLKWKESDRLNSLRSELGKMGGKIMINGDDLIINGPMSMHGATIFPHNDHRVAMACAVAALGADGDTDIQDSECVRKSYPGFFDDLRCLGADVVGR
jgi:3-phosphoshikimate 1-carboxyvinyltransferase